MHIAIPTCTHELMAVFEDANQLHQMLYREYPTVEEWLAEFARVAVAELEPDQHEYLFTMTNPDVRSIPPLLQELSTFLSCERDDAHELTVGFLRRAFVAISGSLN